MGKPAFCYDHGKDSSTPQFGEADETMLNGFQQTTGKYRKRTQRGKGIKLVGIKSLQCNYKLITTKYNPHFHIIVANMEMGEIIKNEWLARCSRHLLSCKAQEMKRVWNNETALIKIVKYGSKIFTEPDIKEKLSRKGERDICTAALHNIFTSMKGLRIFDRFGFDLPDSGRESKSTLYKDHQQWTFEPKVLIGSTKIQMLPFPVTFIPTN